MLIRTTPNEMLFYIFIMFPIATLIQGLPMFSAINKLIVVIIILLMLIAIFLKPVSISQITELSLTIILTIAMIVMDVIAPDAVVVADYVGKTNILMYFPIWCIQFIYFQSNYPEFVFCVRKHLRLIRTACFVWCLLFIISLANPSSYVNKWDGQYFTSFSASPHRLASSCIFVLALCWVLSSQLGRKRYYLLCTVPLLGVLMAGARTYLAVAIMTLLGMYYSELRNTRLFFLTMLPIAVVGIPIVMLSPIGSKLITTMSGDGYGDYWFVVTSGRSAIWGACLKTFWDSSFIHKLIGGGAMYVHRLNNASGFVMRWAHNDFFQLLLANGILGLFLYFALIFRFIRKYIRYLTANLSKMLVLLFYLIWFFNAFFNGVYFYLCASLSLPFIFFMAFRDRK